MNARVLSAVCLVLMSGCGKPMAECRPLNRQERLALIPRTIDLLKERIRTTDLGEQFSISSTRDCCWVYTMRRTGILVILGIEREVRYDVLISWIDRNRFRSFYANYDSCENIIDSGG